MASLISLEDARTLLGFDSSQDDFYQMLIDNASAYIERRTKMKFPPTTVTDELDGGFLDLILRNRPIVSVTTVKDFADPANPLTIEAADFTVYPEKGIIRFSPRGENPVPNSLNLLPISSTWAAGNRRWEIVYVAGFASGVPDDIRQAVVMLISFWAAASSSGGGAFQSESIGDYSYQLGSSVNQAGFGGGIPPSVNDILKHYAEISF